MEEEADVRKALSFLCRGALSEYLRRRTGKPDVMTESKLFHTCTAPLLGELVMHLGSEDQKRREKVSRVGHEGLKVDLGLIDTLGNSIRR
jgi:hypothetical protein